MQQRNKFEIQAHDIQYRKRDKREAHLGETHNCNDTFLYTVMIVLITFFTIILVAVVINT